MDALVAQEFEENAARLLSEITRNINNNVKIDLSLVPAPTLIQAKEYLKTTINQIEFDDDDDWFSTIFFLWAADLKAFHSEAKLRAEGKEKEADDCKKKQE